MSAIYYPYLGTPGAMQQLQSPNGPLDAPPGRGEVVHTLINGGTSVTRRLHAKRTYTLPYTSLYTADADTVLAFYQGLYGEGPFVLIDPTKRNVLGLDTSTASVRVGSLVEWKPSTGTVITSTNTPPVGVPTGVLNWDGLAASATIMPGSVASTADTAHAPVYLPTEAHTISIYLSASTSATVTLQAAGCNAAGAVTVTSNTASAALTTSWQRFTVTVAKGAGAYAACAFLLPRILLGGTVPSNVYLAGAQLEYGTAATAFQPGYGSPRVMFTQSPGYSAPVFGYADLSLTLAEV